MYPQAKHHKIALIAGMLSCLAPSAQAETYTPLQEQYIEKGWKGDIIWQGEAKGQRVVLTPSFEATKQKQPKMVLNFRGYGSHCIDEMVEKNKSPDGKTMYMIPTESNGCKEVEKLNLIALDERQLRVEVFNKGEVVASGSLWPHNGHAGLKMYAPIKSQGIVPKLPSSSKVAASAPVKTTPEVKERSPIAVSKQTSGQGFDFGSTERNSPRLERSAQNILADWMNSGKATTQAPSPVEKKPDVKKMTITEIAAAGKKEESGFGFKPVSTVSTKETNNALAGWGQKGKVANQNPATKKVNNPPALPKSLDGFYWIPESGNVNYLTGKNENLSVYSSLQSQATYDQGVRSGELIGKVDYDPNHRRAYYWEKLKMEPNTARKYSHCKGGVYSSRETVYLKPVQLADGSYATDRWKAYPANKKGTCVYPITSQNTCSVVRCNKYEYAEMFLTKDRELAMRLGRELQASSTGKSYAEKKREANQLETEGQRKQAAKNLEMFMDIFKAMGQRR